MADTGTSRVRVVIVDDDERSELMMRSVLAADGDVEIVGGTVTASEARRRIAELQPDVVFVDMELLHELPEPLPYVIVVTEHSELAHRAFDLQAGDFLVKPLRRQRLADSLHRAKRRIAERRVAGYAMQIAGAAAALNGNKAIGAVAPFELYPNQMTIRVRRRMFSVDVDDIAWIQGASQYSRLHTTSGEYLLSRTLASLECELDPARFFRIHRSAIVNASYVREVRSRGDGCYNVYLRGGQALPMGRARREILHKLLGGVGSEDNRMSGVPDRGSAWPATAVGSVG